MPLPAEGGTSWQALVLEDLGAPVTTANVDALTWWAASEGTPASWHNWLATTEPGYGGHDVNSVGVKAYPSTADGAKATAATLRLSYYTAVVRAFRDNAGIEAIYKAVNASPWCKGCQAGHYPVVLYDHVGKSLPPAHTTAQTRAPARKDPGMPGYLHAAWGNLSYLVGKGGRDQHNKITSNTDWLRRMRG